MSLAAAHTHAECATAIEREERLLALIGELPSAVVAFSGGVDSSYLVHAAARALGRRVVAVTALAPSVPRIQRDMARAIAAHVGVEHVLIDTSEMDDPRYRQNAPDRCYFCKSELYGRLEELAAVRGWQVILSGTNADDLGDYRPGLAAALKRKVRHPLAEVGLGKREIRELSRRAGLPTWDAPASPCLSSRIPYGQEVTVEKLSQIEAAEALLRAHGFRELRVRHHGDVARIELGAADLAALAAHPEREAIVRALKALGFRYVALDLEGFRSGSLNEGLSSR